MSRCIIGIEIVVGGGVNRNGKEADVTEGGIIVASGATPAAVKRSSRFVILSGNMGISISRGVVKTSGEESDSCVEN